MKTTVQPVHDPNLWAPFALVLFGVMSILLIVLLLSTVR
jgi:hypothetical protein